LSFEALLEPSDPASFSYLERYAVAAFTAGLLGAPAAEEFYRDLLRDEDESASWAIAELLDEAVGHPFRTPAPAFRARTGSSNPRHWPERMRPARGSPRRRNRQRLWMTSSWPASSSPICSSSTRATAGPGTWRCCSRPAGTRTGSSLWPSSCPSSTSRSASAPDWPRWRTPPAHRRNQPPDPTPAPSPRIRPR